jgi:hypothetical protein
VDTVLEGMSKHFDGRYSQMGRPSIVTERLLRAPLLQVLMVQLNHNLLFRSEKSFVGPPPPVISTPTMRRFPFVGHFERVRRDSVPEEKRGRLVEAFGR